MKTYKFIINGVIATLLVFVSCDESKIELNNPNQLLVETFFKSSVQLESAVNSSYVYLQEVGNYGRYQFYINDNIAGENYAFGNLEADKVQMINHTIDEANNGNNQFWQHNYQGIGRANFVIENEANFENIPATDASERLGEARFLRALFFFNLVTKYGEVPLSLNSEEVAGGRPKSTIAEIYAAIVIDLNYAANNLPNKANQEPGRATSGAAWSLLGKALLQNNDAAGAKTALANVTGYSLVDNYIENFGTEKEHNAESIFEVNFNEANANAWGTNYDGRGNSETSYRAAEYTGFLNVKPSQALLDEYEDGDRRFAYTFYSIDDSNNGTMTNTYNNGESTYVAGGLGGSDDNPAWRKYQNLDNRESETTTSGINARILRYADVLLMKAEAEIRSGGSEAIALGYINEVRSRPSVAMPDVTATGTADILEAIKHERWVELAGEQSRYLDLQRFDGFDYLMPIPNIELQGNTNL